MREPIFRRIAPLVFLLALQGFAAPRGKLVAVRAGGDEATAVVELVGDRPLSFTTLRLSRPPRVVVDFADTELSGVPSELRVLDGTVRVVGATQASARTARVVIELMGEAEFEVRAQGTTLEVRMQRLAPLLAAAARPEPEPPPMLLAQRDLQQAPAQAPPVQPTSAPPESEQAAPPASDPIEAALAPAPTLERSNQPAPAKLPTPGPDRTEPQPTAPPPAQAAPAPFGAAPSATAAAPPLAAAKPASPLATRPEPSDAERRASLPTVALLGSSPHRAAAPEPQSTEPSRAEDRAPGRTEPASSTPPARNPAPAPQRRLKGAHPEPGFSITGIGFRQIGAGVVVLRSDRPLEYSVSEEPLAVVVHLPAARIPMANNRLPLDTSIFGGPVGRLSPVQTLAGVDLRIELREHAGYHLEQSGPLLTLTFETP